MYIYDRAQSIIQKLENEKTELAQVIDEIHKSNIALKQELEIMKENVYNHLIKMLFICC
jgi:predicted RNase H-like nuclease (RuvC/YqgF family)